MKTAKERLDDTLAYMAKHLSGVDMKETNDLVTALGATRGDGINPLDDLSSDMSIDNSNPFRKDARRAKRALILLASLLINDDKLRRDEVTRIKGLSEKSEPNLIAEMKSWFTIPGVTPAHVSLLAKSRIGAMPKWNNVNLESRDAIRGVYDKNKPFNCYNAVVFWAFQAGAISKRYYWNKLQDKNGNDFFPIFSQCGWEEVIKYDGGRPPKLLFNRSPNGDYAEIPAGTTVYFETPSKVFGHVAMALGDGTVISQNSVIPAIGLANLDPKWAAEVHKMTLADCHIISIAYMLKLHFHPENAYPVMKITSKPFWTAHPLSER